MEAYLKPGEYRVRLRVYCRENILAFEGIYLLTSPDKPEGLAIRRLPSNPQQG